MHTNLNFPNMGESLPPMSPPPLWEHTDVPCTPLAPQGQLILPDIILVIVAAKIYKIYLYEHLELLLKWIIL